MRLPEIITYCQLKGYVKKHIEIAIPVHDHECDGYFQLELEGSGCTASVKYATLKGHMVTVHCSLYNHSKELGTKIIFDAELADIEKAFIPS